MKVNLSQIAATEPTRLQSIHNQMIMERMELDKQLSLFLDKNTWTMDDNYESSIWKSYKAMTRQYKDLNQQIRIAEYYMKAH